MDEKIELVKRIIQALENIPPKNAEDASRRTVLLRTDTWRGLKVAAISKGFTMEQMLQEIVEIYLGIVLPGVESAFKQSQQLSDGQREELENKAYEEIPSEGDF